MKTLSSVTLLSIFAVVASFGLRPSTRGNRICTTQIQGNRRHVIRLMGGPQDGTVRRPSNEFSRTVPPDKVLKLHGKHQRTNSINPMQQRQYSVDIDASTEECEALADRFQLPDIERLEASMLLSPEGSSGVDSARGILVEGRVQATVTRTCVRTNQNFQEDVDFAVYSVVRPVNGVGSSAAVQPEKDASVVQLTRSTGRKKKKKKRQNEQSTYDEDDIDPMEMMRMQSMLNDLDQQEDEYEDVLMEDEAIFATNGMLDVGELISQLLWLQLDPYPRKPGGPEVLQFSITG